MSDIRGNALAIVQNLKTVRNKLVGLDKMASYQSELVLQDVQLRTDINALIDPSRAYFRRVYVEELARGDGLWQQTMPDRANEGGTTFAYRLALPTALHLMNVRLAVMKFTSPLSAVQGTFREEIMHWWECLRGIRVEAQRYVWLTPPVPVEVQCVRRQVTGDKLGSFRDWQLHREVVPPFSINPVGIADITTGPSWIDWNHLQFDEWYLSKGDLHGQDAGYWPPSIGVQFCRPPPAATGLPPLDRAIMELYAMCTNNATRMASESAWWTGVAHADVHAWKLLQYAKCSALSAGKIVSFIMTEFPE